MQRRVHIAFAVVLLLLASVTAWLGLREREPEYQGKRLSVWLDLLLHSKAVPRYAGPEAEAIRHFGTNALPVLIEKLHAQDTPLEQLMTRWAKRQNFVHLHFIPADERRWEALWGYQALGPIASVQVLSLSATLTNEPSPDVRRAAAVAFEFIGPEARLAAPALFRATKDTDPSIRACAFGALARIRPDARLTIPVLVGGLQDPVLFVQQYAAGALKEYGPEARVAVPVLLRMLPTDKVAGIVDDNAVSALKAIDPEAASTAGVQ